MSDTEKIAAGLLNEILHVVHWEDCTLHQGGVLDAKDHIAQAVLRAAQRLKALGLSWEEWS